MGKCDTSRLNTLLIYFECTGKESVSESESNVSVLNRGNEPIIRIRFGFVFKLGCVPPVSKLVLGWVPVLFFGFLRMGVHADEPQYVYYSYDLYYLVSF